jgi:hypothetical protein
MALETEAIRTREAVFISDPMWLWAAKAAGAVAGSAISLAYVLPDKRREAAIRFGVGVASGLVFGGTVGLKIAVELGIEKIIGPFELVLMGAAAASLCAWWALGLVIRTLKANTNKRSGENER